MIEVLALSLLVALLWEELVAGNLITSLEVCLVCVFNLIVHLILKLRSSCKAILTIGNAEVTLCSVARVEVVVDVDLVYRDRLESVLAIGVRLRLDLTEDLYTSYVRLGL